MTAEDFVINDDMIIIGSLCVGFDCVNGEVFSFDTIRLKENNLRIKFDDTSRRQRSRAATGRSRSTARPTAARATSGSTT
jgi:hypothetical protein